MDKIMTTIWMQFLHRVYRASNSYIEQAFVAFKTESMVSDNTPFWIC